MPRPTKKPYVPHGKMIPLLAALEAEPEREFTGYEAAEIIGGDVRQVSSFVFYAERAGRVFKRIVKQGRLRYLLLRATPFPDAQPVRPSEDIARQGWKEGRAVRSEGWTTDPDDIRIGKVVPGWKPPVMRCVRGA
jgi:hypothetical protein